MTACVTSLWRHPIKSHGREPLTSVALTPGETLPGDRVWAVAHDQSDVGNDAWSPCANFSRVSKTASLMAISSRLDDETGLITLTHPERPELTFDPDGDPAAFLAWITPLMDPKRAMPARFVKVPGRGMTDSDFPSITLCNMASHCAVEKQMGQPLSMHRWRGNVWFDTNLPWEEFNWIGKKVQIGEAVFEVREPTDRCEATNANPESGRRDTNILGTLEKFGHQDFSVRAVVIEAGTVSIGDLVHPL